MTPRLETPEEARARLEGEALGEHERAALWRRIESSVAARSAARGRRAAKLALPAFALATAAAALLWWTSRAAESTPGPSPRVADACTLDANAHELRLPVSCGERTLRVGADEWQLAPGADVARTPDGIRVRAGRVRFSVKKRAAGEQLKVRVSHGEVRVIGTVFVIEQHAASGSITVSEGVIELVYDDATRVRVAAGQTAHWPRPAPSATAPQPLETRDAGAPGKPKLEPAPDLDQVLERLLQLRSQQRYPEAVTLLRATLSTRGLSRVQRERISYELGLALEASGAPSCPHWQDHVHRFGRARHAEALAIRMRTCPFP